MKVYLFSKGETTTDLAKWSFERLGGLEVILLQDPKTTFYEKYNQFVDMALEAGDDTVVRADADVIATRNFKNLLGFYINNPELWWVTGKAFCFMRMEIIDTVPGIMNRKALLVCKKHIDEVSGETRPETELTRMPELMDPRRFLSADIFVGLHGYKQSAEDVVRVIAQKSQRGQLKNWDLDLITKMQKL